MEKKEYSRAKIVITEFEVEDVITSSGMIMPDGEDDDMELLPKG